MPVENIIRYERERMVVWAVDAVMAMDRLAKVPELDRRDRQRAAGIRLFESVRKGSYEVTLNTPGIQHGSFTDLPLLGKALGDQERAMMLIRAHSVAFFDQAFGRKPKGLPPQPDVHIDRYSFREPLAN